MKRAGIALAVIAIASVLGTRLGAQHVSSKVESLRERRLIDLTRKQSRDVCEVADTLQDLCAVAGRHQNNRGLCEAAVETCRQQQPGPHIDCSLAQFDFGEGCTATVGDYLTCVEDWNESIACSQIEFFSPFGPDVRAACLPLLEKCPHFSAEYGDPSRFVPQCDAQASPVRVDKDDDVHGLDRCRPAPARMVTLGDSIASCFLTAWDPEGGPSGCAPNLIADYLREHYAPDLVYEDHSVPGAVTADGIVQAQGVAPGPGHIFVWVYLGGNDLLGCGGTEGNDATVACMYREIDEIRAEWEPILAYFSDPALFPDGATFLLNTQYQISDECENPGGMSLGTTQARSAAVQAYNQRVFIDRAVERADAIAVDQYPDWLGHGIFADNARCPHCYREDNVSWLYPSDVHPNPTGHRHIAAKWKLAIDQMLQDCGP
ncbi:MAG TPA: GDSL-type esterase/lipase family protein [Polyangiales bacterium]|nr:GDSL-type esterase/lipase family protein [Polyangiales bacterium]